MLKIFEEEPRNLTEAILRILAAGAVLPAILIMPGVGRLFVEERSPWKKFDEKKLKPRIKNLLKRKLLAIGEEDGEVVIKLAEKGKTYLLKYDLERMKIKKPGKWDGKWRVVVFDIPNSQKGEREVFREKLKQLEFYPLQKSVFLTPYPCFSEIEFLRQVLGVGEYVRILMVEKLEGENLFKRHFGL
ncbi:MAG: hypothetical protein ACOZBZ_02885 [Patescibacteria group bacterium]